MRDLSHEATELVLHIENTQRLSQLRNAINANLARKHAKGTYDSAKAPAAFRHLADVGAMSYRAEFMHHTDTTKVFSVADRKAVAADYARHFDSCIAQDCIGDLGAEAEDVILNSRAPKLTMADIRAAHMEAGFHFFDRKSMAFFGDTMRSFAVHQINGATYLRRVRPMYDRSGRNMGGVGKLYLYDYVTHSIRSVSDILA